MYSCRLQWHRCTYVGKTPYAYAQYTSICYFLLQTEVKACIGRGNFSALNNHLQPGMDHLRAAVWEARLWDVWISFEDSCLRGTTLRRVDLIWGQLFERCDSETRTSHLRTAVLEVRLWDTWISFEDSCLRGTTLRRVDLIWRQLFERYDSETRGSHLRTAVWEVRLWDAWISQEDSCLRGTTLRRVDFIWGQLFERDDSEMGVTGNIHFF